MRQERYLNQLSLSEVRGGGGDLCVCGGSECECVGGGGGGARRDDRRPNEVSPSI